MRRFTALLNCNTDTVGPCLTLRAVRRLVSDRVLSGSCCTTMSSCGRTIVDKVMGVTSGVNVSAVRSCRKSRVFRTVNVSSSIVRGCFANAIDHINKVALRSVRRGMRGLRSRTFSPLKLPASLALSDINTRGVEDRKRRRHCGPRAVRLLRRSA